MRAIIAAAEPAEELVLANMHLVQLTSPPNLPSSAGEAASHDTPPEPGR
jgi:hypothetical protein